MHSSPCVVVSLFSFSILFASNDFENRLCKKIWWGPSVCSESFPLRPIKSPQIKQIRDFKVRIFKFFKLAFSQGVQVLLSMWFETNFLNIVLIFFCRWDIFFVLLQNPQQQNSDCCLAADWIDCQKIKYFFFVCNYSVMQTFLLVLWRFPPHFFSPEIENT